MYKLIIILLFMSKLALSAELSVTVDRHEIFKNEILNVEITIKDANLRSEPDFSKIKDSFKILKQFRSSSHSVINGSVTQKEIYQLQLQAINFGTIAFPALSVNTSEGVLTSDSFTINIKDEVGTSSDHSLLAKIEATISDSNIHLGEYALLKLKISMFRDIINAQITIPESDIALVEKVYATQPTVKTVNGIRTETTEITYKIKPAILQDINIDQIILTGQIRKDTSNSNNFFSRNNMFFAPSIANNYQEIQVVSNKIPTIKVTDLGKAHISTTEFTKKQTISSTSTTTDQPVNLSFTLTSINNTPDILPEIELSSNETASFYKEKTLTSETYDPTTNKITTTKTQNFTIIPKKAGSLTIDEVKIPWLNKKTNRISELVLSKMDLTITDPTTEYYQTKSALPENLPEEIIEDTVVRTSEKPTVSQINKYLVITVILLFIYSTILTIKLIRLEKNKTTNKKLKRHLLTLASNFDEVRLFLFQHFNRKFKQNIENFDDIKNIIRELELSENIIKDLTQVIDKVERSLYGGHVYDFNFVKTELSIKLKYIKKSVLREYLKKQKLN